MWATVWMGDANEVIRPLLALPRLSVVPFAEVDEAVPAGLNWKTAALVRWASGRPFVRVDDDIGEIDRQWVEAAHPGPALLNRVNRATGLTDADFGAIKAWLRDLRGQRYRQPLGRP